MSYQKKKKVPNISKGTKLQLPLESLSGYQSQSSLPIMHRRTTN